MRYALPVAAATLAIAALAVPAPARAEDPIVGVWTGKLSQTDNEPFEMTATFVSPRGGVTRYPGFPCGGVLVGNRRGGSDYEYEETISWGGPEEVDPGCISGNVSVSVNGDKMQFTWTGASDGQQYKAAGELTRQRAGGGGGD
jgi:hypothetical protein